MNRNPNPHPHQSRPPQRRQQPRPKATRNPGSRRRRAKRQALMFGLLLLLLVILIVLLVVVLVGSGSGGGEGTGSGIDTTESSGAENGDGQTSGDEHTTQLPPDVPAAFVVPEVSFTADLTEYEKYMNPQGEDRDAYLLLVNADNPLGEHYAPSDLLELEATRDDGRSAQTMREYAAKALDALFLEADALGHINDSTGYELSVTSAYRSYSYQDYLFTTRVDSLMQDNPDMTREEAEAQVVKATCRAGTSEHQTGLCCDMHNQASASSKNPGAFANTPEGQWVTENAWKFGFILRFPEDKTEITGITYESWHFRYVGRYHAYQMKMLDMCLEEYVEYLEKLE